MSESESSIVRTIQVVGAAVLRGGRCLATQRSASMPLPLLWEFPGGKVEPGEDPRVALRRELREELGIDIQVGVELGRGSSAQAEELVELTVYAATLLSGPVELREHRAYGWFDAEELASLDWAEADVPVLPAVTAALAQCGV